MLPRDSPVVSQDIIQLLLQLGQNHISSFFGISSRCLVCRKQKKWDDWSQISHCSQLSWVSFVLLATPILPVSSFPPQIAQFPSSSSVPKEKRITTNGWIFPILITSSCSLSHSFASFDTPSMFYELQWKLRMIQLVFSPGAAPGSGTEGGTGGGGHTVHRGGKFFFPVQQVYEIIF